MNILIGISGGVDSAVAAHILKSQGHCITAAMMKIYSGKSLKLTGNSCYASDKSGEVQDAEKICEQLKCRFSLIDVSDEFDKLVFSVFKNEYMNARTPNPCVLCNPLIKFGVFPQKAKALGIPFDKFATGHYVRNYYDSCIGKYILKKSINCKKDQSYFLYALNQEILANTLFPLGEMSKDDVRNYARLNNIPVACKQDSQDFYSGKYSDLFDTKDIQGEIVDKFGNVLGIHHGLHNYTIGQRKGILVSHSFPLYVVGFDMSSNRLIVSTKDDTYSNGLIATNLSWIFWEKPRTSFTAMAKIRSSQEPFECTVNIDNGHARVVFSAPQCAVAPGQAIVFYDNEIVLGGGTILSNL